MKRAVLGILVFLVSATLAGAALLLDDSFSYSDGPLVTVSGGVWVHHSGSAGEVMVSSWFGQRRSGGRVRPGAAE